MGDDISGYEINNSIELLYRGQSIMMPVFFISQIAILVLGLGVGYWLLIKADTQEESLKSIGKNLAWALITVTTFLAICNFFYSIIILNKYVGGKYCPGASSSELQQQAEQENDQASSQGDQNSQPIEDSQSTENPEVTENPRANGTSTPVGNFQPSKRSQGSEPPPPIGNAKTPANPQGKELRPIKGGSSGPFNN